MTSTSLRRLLTVACLLAIAVGGCGDDSGNSKPDASTNGGAGTGSAGNTGGGGGHGGAGGAGNAVDAGMGALRFNAPPVAPIVRDATPEALRPASSAMLLRSVKELLGELSPISYAHAQALTNVNDSIKAFFKDDYTKISGGKAQGLINSSLEDLDSRMMFVDMAPAQHPCLDGPAKPFRVDLTGIAPALDLTLNVQCNAGTLMAFGRDPNGGNAEPVADGGIDADGGTVKLGGAYSLWLYLGQSNGKDAFGYYANVENSGTPDEWVDYMFLENFPTYSRIEAYRVRAKPKTNVFEFTFATTDGGGASGDNLKCGFQMISDGNYIWAVGSDHQPNQSCGDAVPFTRCLSANDLTEQSSDAPCNALKTSFTMQMLTADEMTGAGAKFDAVLPVTSAKQQTVAF